MSKVIAFVFVACVVLVTTASPSTNFDVTLFDAELQSNTTGVPTDIFESWKEVDVADIFSDVEVPFNKTDDPCCDCTRGAAHWVLKHVIEHIKHRCETTQDPREKEHCRWMAEHRDMVLGMLIENVRPASIGRAYCAGKGVCHAGSENTFLGQNLVEPIDVEIISRNIDSDSALASIFSPNFEKDADRHEETEDRPPRPDDERMMGVEGRHSEERCHKCIGWTIHRVMEHVIRQFIEWCHHTQDERAQAYCHWAKEHKGVFYGMSFAKTEPCKFASGFCLGAHACGHHGHHHHHHRHREDDD